MNIMSLRDDTLPSTAKRACGKQSPDSSGDCFATCAGQLAPRSERNDMQDAALRGPHKRVILRSQTQEELDALLPSVLDRAFKGEL